LANRERQCAGGREGAMKEIDLGYRLMNYRTNSALRGSALRQFYRLRKVPLWKRQLRTSNGNRKPKRK
jgi:hypothetical protein